jgi:stage II sporulation protein D
MINRAIFTLPIIFSLAMPARAETKTPWFGDDQKAEIVNVELPQKIRVSLLHTRKPLTIGGSGPYTCQINGKFVKLNGTTNVRIRGARRGLLVGNKSVSSSLKIAPLTDTDHLLINGRAYRGVLTVRSGGGGTVDVIESIDIEEYLKGVLPREVGSDWPAESLKAQAVISRTFVIANLGRYAAKGYDVRSDVYSQVYGGKQVETPTTSQAVEDTRGEILVDEGGSAALTFFHSSCGGRTEAAQYVWQDQPVNRSYLASVKDPYCKDDPFYHWRYEISAERLQRRLRTAGYRVALPKKVSIAKTSPSGRAWVWEIRTSKGKINVPGNSFRLAVGPELLRSTLIMSVSKRGNSFRFEGRGWGHGVGLCQWGARGRASEGHSYRQILQAYYPQIRWVKAGPSR